MSNRGSIILSFLLLLVTAGMPVAAGRMAELHHGGDPHDIPPSLPDSISLLLFAGFNLDHLIISSPRGSVLDDRPDAARMYVVNLVDGTLTLNGTTTTRCTIAPTGSDALKLSTGQRKKQLRGRLSITADGDQLVIVGRMALRDYLAAALATEASASEPMEFLVALSVMQRNYVASHRDRHAPHADLCDVTHCQLADFTGVSSRIYAAVDRGMKLSLTAGDGWPCYYSVNCGGSTLTPAQIWRSDEPGYSRVTCSHCRGSQRFRWTRTIPTTPDVEAVLRDAPAPPFVDDDFKIRLGRIAGFNKVLSNTIDRIERRRRNYVLSGRGFGHRVGLCMEGAGQLARQGRSAEDILRFYFPTAQLRTQP